MSRLQRQRKTKQVSGHQPQVGAPAQVVQTIRERDVRENRGVEPHHPLLAEVKAEVGGRKKERKTEKRSQRGRKRRRLKKERENLRKPQARTQATQVCHQNLKNPLAIQ